jgi:transmembrane sensor
MSMNDIADRQADPVEEALRWIVRLNSGAATPDDTAAYEAWRTENTRHALAAQEAERLWAAMGNLHFDRRSGHVLAAPKQGLTRRGALSLFLCLGAGGVAGGALWSSGLLDRLSADYATDTASLQIVDLPDGSRVSLNARSALDVDFSDGMRRVHLRAGQAYFEVAANPARPFEVMVDELSFRAMGTAFDIARDLPDARAELAVTEHSVRIRTVSGDTLDVGEGEVARIDRQGRIGAAAKTDALAATGWRDGQYVAEGRSLEEVVSALSAWHRGVILIMDGQIGKLRVNAVLDLRDVNGSLDALQGGLPIKVRHISKYFAIIS